MPSLIFLYFQEKIEIQGGIATILKYFSYIPPFFYTTSFYATLEKIEIFMPPHFYATLKILMPPFLWHPGGGIKKGAWYKQKPMVETPKYVKN